VSALSARRLRSALFAAGLALPSACGPAPTSAPPQEEVPLPRLAGVDPDVVEAIQAAREAVREEPTGDNWGRLGNRYFAHDFLPEAQRCFARAEALDPERYLWTYRRGLCLIDDDPAEAALHLLRSLRSLDEHAPAHETYAHVLFRLGRLDEAIAHYERASALDARSAHAETGLGQVLLARGDLAGARTHLEAALARDERHVEAHVALAQAYLGLGLEKKAQYHAELSRTLPQSSKREDVFASPSVTPAGARARTKYGKQLEKQGKLEEACEQYRIALRCNPDHYAARWSLASLLAQLGRKDEAVELLREAERRNPGFDQVRADLARLLDPGSATGPRAAEE
jgi:tetratricopeptide (TPR) repeat protein